MNEITGLGILSSMITPAVLILASGQLILTTSQRLSRVVERVRKLSAEFMQVEKGNDPNSANESKRRILYTLLHKSARRSKLLTRAMTFLYVSLGLFVATSLTIGIVAVTHLRYTWIPTAIGMIGAITLFISSAILIVESRVTYSVITDEVDFVIESSTPNAPEALRREAKLTWRKLLGLKK
jgi:FlaA1/EpsC-like NDP-sugar epimerase